jgi:hypothetical protein
LLKRASKVRADPAQHLGSVGPRSVRGQEAAEIIAEAAHPDANIIFGAVVDDRSATKCASP